MSRRWSLEILDLAPKSVVASEVVEKAKKVYVWRPGFAFLFQTVCDIIITHALQGDWLELLPAGY